MLEMAIVTPLLLTLCIGIFDVSRLVLTHLALTQYAREGARLASSDELLESGAFRLIMHEGNPQCIDVSSDTGTNSPGTDCIATSAQRAILLKLYNMMRNTSALRDVKMEGFQILGEFESDADMVRYSVSAPFDGFFQWFDGYRVVVAASGPYL